MAAGGARPVLAGGADYGGWRVGAAPIAAGAQLKEATVRVAGASDRDAIQSLVSEAFVVERRIKKGGGDRLDPSGRELEALLGRGVFLLLEEQGKPAATVYVELRGERCYLGLLAIAPARQGSGLGRRMAAAAEAYARVRGCRWMDLRVVSARRNGLVPLYEKLGYREVGRQEYPEELAAAMVDPGCFILMSKEI